MASSRLYIQSAILTHRTGYLATVFDSFEKPFPRQQPWLDYWEVVGDASAGTVSISNVTLTNWTATGSCAMRAMQTNPSSLDLNAVHQVLKLVELLHSLPFAKFSEDFWIRVMNTQACANGSFKGVFSTGV